MFGLEKYDALFVVWSFLFQIFLIIHFAVRKWNLYLIMRYGWIFYAFSIAAVVVSFILLLGGKTWSFWLGGFIFFIWANFGFTVEYVMRIEWRDPISWPIFAPYVLLYLATVMFYWWPLALISRPLWYVYAVLFIASTVLNVTSH
ncbi:MAG TPA: hypothetical protein G4N92_04355 [Anaerolineae bacterium]|nr:hypothetical protein [Anaerolineae bacterium]